MCVFIGQIYERILYYTNVGGDIIVGVFSFGYMTHPLTTLKVPQKKLIYKLWVNYFCRILALMLFF